MRVIITLIQTPLLYCATFMPSAWAISPPSQVAIAAGASADSQVSITWLTDDTRDDDSSCAEVAIVRIWDRFGLNANVSAVVQCHRYSFQSDARTNGNYTSGRIHKVYVSGLLPNSNYTYELEGDIDASVQRHFRTLPQYSSSIYPMSFGVVADLGQTKFSEDTVRHLDSDKSLRIVLHPGDMPYADTRGDRWDSYGKMVEPLSSRLQWMVSPGNHEIEANSYTGEIFGPYEKRFAMPAVQPAVSKPVPSLIGCVHPWPPGGQFPGHPDCTPSALYGGHYDWGNSFFAFTAGPARVVALNPYTSTAPDSAQHEWMEEEFARLRQKRAETPWLIVLMHCPWYNSNPAHQGEIQTVLMRDAHGWEDLFFENNVSLVLTGHVHAYERSHQVYQNQTNPGGPAYIVAGDGGNREGLHKYPGGAPAWSAYRNGTAYGHGKVTLVNDTHMHWQWLVDDVSIDSHARVANRVVANRVAQDEAWIVNPWVAPPAPKTDFKHLYV